MARWRRYRDANSMYRAGIKHPAPRIRDDPAARIMTAARWIAPTMRPGAVVGANGQDARNDPYGQGPGEPTMSQRYLAMARVTKNACSARPWRINAEAEVREARAAAAINLEASVRRDRRGILATGGYPWCLQDTFQASNSHASSAPES